MVRSPSNLEESFSAAAMVFENYHLRMHCSNGLSSIGVLDSPNFSLNMGIWLLYLQNTFG